MGLENIIKEIEGKITETSNAEANADNVKRSNAETNTDNVKRSNAETNTQDLVDIREKK